MDTSIIIAVISTLIIIYLSGFIIHKNTVTKLYNNTSSTIGNTFIYIHKNLVIILFLIAIAMIIFM
jgi:hypothetical protein